MPTLGCATNYSAVVTTRGGGATVATLTPTDIKWSRKNSATSTASVTLGWAAGPTGSDCCGDLDDVNPWQHELSISRNGTQVWVGPITEIEYEPDSVTIQASDMSAWLDRRRLTQRLDRVNVLPEQYARHVCEQAIQHDNSMGLVIDVWSASVGGGITRAVKFRDFRMCSAEMSDLAATWIDWWVVLRTIYLAGYQFVSSEASLTDSHFLSIAGVRVHGATTGNNFVITGRGRGSRGVEKYGASEGDTSTFGLHHWVEADDNLHKEEDLESKASRRVTRFNRVTTTFGGGQVADTFPLSVNDIHPGVVVSVDLTYTCRTITGDYKIVGVDVSVNHDGEDFSIEVERLGAG